MARPRLPLARGGGTLEGMRFHVTLTLEFQAESMEAAGGRVQELVDHARDVGHIEVRDLLLRTPPAREPVSLPPVARPSPPPETELFR
jgi:hypothetical protein